MFAVIYIPDFYLQAALRPESHLGSRPVALVDEAGQKVIVRQLTSAALQEGVHVGMTPTQAQARCPELLIKRRCSAQEAAADTVLLQCAFSFSPQVEATAEGVHTLDLAGFRDLDYEGLGQSIIHRLTRLHLAAQVGVAENPLLAWLAAQSARPCQVVRHSAEFLRALPVASVAPSPEMLHVLQKWGIDTLGALTGLGKEDLAERLGAEALAMFARATANSSRPLRLAQLPETFEETSDFEQEIETVAPLLFLLHRFLEQISLRLEMNCWVAEEIRLRLALSDGTACEQVFQVPEPTRQLETLFRMLQTRLENLRTAHPIVGLHLSAKPTRAIPHQFGLFERAVRYPNQFYETLTRLAGLLGPERVGTPVVLETHQPDAFRLEPLALQKRETTAASSRALGRQPGLPLHRFRPALPATVEIEAERPAFLESSVCQGRIVQAVGPWRSSGFWWDVPSWDRDEWDIQTSDGGLYRLCRQKEKWTVEGVYS
jgi:protein ImuB